MNWKQGGRAEGRNNSVGFCGLLRWWWGGLVGGGAEGVVSVAA